MTEVAGRLQLFRARRTIMELVKDRGYIVSDSEIEMTIVQFLEKYGEISEREVLDFSRSKHDDPSDKISVFFVDEEDGKRFGKDRFLEYHERMEQDKELMVNITKYSLVPKHQVLTANEVKILLDQYHVNLIQLPHIKVSDPIARYFGLKRGQVMRISRPISKPDPPKVESETDGKSETTSDTAGKNETAGQTETASETAGKGETTSDTAGKNETAGQTETASETAGKGETASDTAGKSEAASETASKNETASDSAGKSETASQTASETAGKNEAASDTADKSDDASETAGKSEAASDTAGKSETASKNETAIDTAGKNETASQTASETAGKSETAKDTAGKSEAASET